jgi:flagellar hook-length control protein FliK
MHSLDAALNPTVSAAQISQNSNHSEMRIAMQSDKLGAIELRARVAGDEFGAAITVEKRDAHAALAVELPALQQALSDKQFRIDQITLLHGSLHSATGDASTQSQAQQGDRGAHHAQVAQSFLREKSGAFVSFQTAAETRGIFDSQGRLSVQA